MSRSTFLPLVIGIVAIIASMVTGWANHSKMEIGMNLAIWIYIMCAIVLAVAVIWQIRIWCRPSQQLQIKFDSQVLVPSMQAQEAVILVAGTIINPRDTPTSIIQLSIIVGLTDGSVIEAQPHDLPLPQTLPFRNETLTFTADKFWPSELEKNQIPAHGASHGFMFGYVSGFASSHLFEQGTAVSLRCKDSDGVTSIFTATKKTPPA
jgi:hypothetical protein